MKSFSVIAAATADTFGIGKQGKLPWKIAQDMAFFKHITSNAPPGTLNALIMGRKTWESIPKSCRPLSGRLNIVLSRDPSVAEKISLPESVVVAQSLEDALSKIEGRPDINSTFVIGGGSVYEEAVQSDLCTKVYLTEVVSSDVEEMDTFFPALPAHRFQITKRSKIYNDGKNSFRFMEFDQIDPNAEIGDDAGWAAATCDPAADGAESKVAKKSDSLTASPSSVAQAPPLSRAGNPEELQYLDIVRDIIENGVLRGDRTGTGTLSKFGVQMRFSLRDGVFPLLTTKKVFWRGVAEELIWFVRGHTNGKLLSDKNIHIWDGNGSREFLDSRGLHHREEMDLGPVYGFQVFIV